MSRSRALGRALGWLERRFGRLEDLVEETSVVLECDGGIGARELVALANHDALAVRVRGFYDAALCEKVALDLVGRESENWQVSVAGGLESSDVRSVATPFNVATKGGDEAVDRYFRTSRQVMRSLRPDGGLSPLDKLRLELDEAWPGGACVSKRDGRPFLAGLPRLMKGPTRWLQGFCHVDDISPARPMRGLFSANVYLQVPDVGGALQIWPLTWRTRWDFYRHATTLSLLTEQTDEAQDRLRAVLPPPQTVEVSPGDLVLLCAQRPHAVMGFPFGTRVSLQSFLTVEGAARPLRMDI